MRLKGMKFRKRISDLKRREKILGKTASCDPKPLRRNPFSPRHFKLSKENSPSTESKLKAI